MLFNWFYQDEYGFRYKSEAYRLHGVLKSRKGSSQENFPIIEVTKSLQKNDTINDARVAL